MDKHSGIVLPTMTRTRINYGPIERKQIDHLLRTKNEYDIRYKIYEYIEKKLVSDNNHEYCVKFQNNYRSKGILLDYLIEAIKYHSLLVDESKKEFTELHMHEDELRFIINFIDGHL